MAIQTLTNENREEYLAARGVKVEDFLAEKKQEKVEEKPAEEVKPEEKPEKKKRSSVPPSGKRK